MALSARDLIREDYRRYRATGWPRLSVIFLAQGFWAGCVYRVSHAALERSRGSCRRPLLRIAAVLAQKLMEIVTGISLPPECEIGPGLYIGHYGAIILHHQARLGANCNISQGVTIGVGGRGAEQGVPVLGDRVHVAPGAIIVGKISIGNDVAIGPGAVVMRSVPDHAVVLGNPGRVVSHDGSTALILTDPPRDADPVADEPRASTATRTGERTEPHR